MSMEVPGAEENNISESHLTSAVAFVEGGIQEACDDACSICLEAFSESDPSTVTGCKHEFHLQCILEWCQRSSQCPMCWQAISLKDPSSQELLEAVEQERNFRLNPSRNATIFHHPTLGDFELQHLPVGANDAELEERIIQHLAAAAAMGRARHIARREGQRSRSSAHGRPHFLVFSNPASTGTTSPSPSQIGENEPPPAVTVGTPITIAEEQLATPSPSTQVVNASPTSSGPNAPVTDQSAASSNNWSSHGQSSLSNQDRGGPSDQSFSESLKSRFNSVSMRYKESISKSTRGWKERFFSRSPSVADLGSEVRREVNAGIATVTRMMERLETRDNNRSNGGSASNSSEGTTVQDLANQPAAETSGTNHSNNANLQASCAPPQV